MKKVILKPGREKSLLHRHPWIFSGAVETLPSFSDGDLLPVYTKANSFIGIGYFNRQSSIIGRMIAFGTSDVEKTLKEKIETAVRLRASLFNAQTTGYRLINAEGDGLPGLIVDRYADVLVVQISTLGMERLKSNLISHLQEIITPRLIYEKSTASSRKEEGLSSQEGYLLGEGDEEVIFLENGLQLIAPFVHGQKTGFFLDQREMRSLVEKLAYSKRVFNGFAYTGGFSLYALRAGAKEVVSVDVSDFALKYIDQQIHLNDLSRSHHTVCCDLFEFIREDSFSFDLVILDPPAFAKKRNDVDNACRGYKELNRSFLEKALPGSLLITSSCSAHISPSLFQMLLFQAARESQRDVKIVGKHIQAPDHPISLYHPEGEYLKSLLLRVE